MCLDGKPLKPLLIMNVRTIHVLIVRANKLGAWNVHYFRSGSFSSLHNCLLETLTRTEKVNFPVVFPSSSNNIRVFLVHSNVVLSPLRLLIRSPYNLQGKAQSGWHAST